MAIFKKKKKVLGSVPAAAPSEPETQAEIAYVEQLSNPSQVAPVAPVVQQPVVQQPVVAPTPTPVPEPVQYREIPVCMTQAQINNLVIENNIMLKEIISRIDEDD